MLEERAVDLQLEEKRYELAMQKLRHQDVELRSRYSHPFKSLSFARRCLDSLSAVLAAASPRNALTSELVGFKARIALSGDSLVGQMKGTLAQIETDISELPKRFEESRLVAIAKAGSDIASLEGTIKEIADELDSEDNEARREEAEAKFMVERWERRLGRSAYFNTFNAFFEENINKWLAGQSWNRTSTEDPAKPESNEEDYSKAKSIIETTRLYVLTLVQSLMKGLTNSRDALRSFTFTAFAPEFLYSYTAFNVIANGDVVTTLSGTFVFTLGILTMGQMSGIAFTRSRYSEGEIETSMPRWRILMTIAAFTFLLLGCCVVYVGASLRGSTGEVVRIKQDIAAAQRRQEPERTIEEMRKRMEALIKHPAPPLETTEGQVALVVYAVFFLSSLMYRVFANDPIFEFGLATRKYSQIRRERLEGQWAAWQQTAMLKAILHWRRKVKLELESSTFSGEPVAEKRKLQEEIDRIQAQLDAYANARMRSFGNTLMTVRRSAALEISAWLDKNSYGYDYRS